MIGGSDGANDGEVVVGVIVVVGAIVGNIVGKESVHFDKNVCRTTHKASRRSAMAVVV